MTTERIRGISSFIVMDVLERAHAMEKEGIHVIHLEVGEPDFDTPACIKAAACQALADGQTHYTHSLGILELREAICTYYAQHYGVSVDPDQIIVCNGTSPAIFLTLSALVNAGEEVILSDPHYACYPNFVRFIGGRPVFVPVAESDGFQYRPDAIAEHISPDTRAIFLNSPANPTGTLLDADRMAAIAEMAPYSISDEIYHGLVYEGKAHSMLEFSDRTFVLNGFSKLYAMTGLRLGYVIAPKKFIRPMQKVAQNFFISANSIVQRAGIAALTQCTDELVQMRNTYNKRRRYMIDRLRGMGFDIQVEPTGAFYVFVNAQHLSTDSYSLAFDILERACVGVTPGIDFGENGEGFLRFSYANSLANITEGMDRLEAYLQQRK